MFTFRTFSLITVFVGALTLAAPSQAQDRAVDDTEGAILFIEQLATDTQNAWSDSTLNKAERDAAFREIFQRATDVSLLGRLMLGRHYRTATPDQRKRYIDTMRRYILAEFAKRMSQIGFQGLEVTGTTPAPGKRGQLFVRTRIERDEGSPILADWRVRKTKDGRFEIVNLEIEGINLVITNRELFSARVKAVGLDGLIEELNTAAETETAAS